jgi:hypothetical protein
MEEQLPKRGVTVILTSCGRQDLLERTIDSFLKFNTYPIDKWWIYEDSGVVGINDRLKEKYPFINWIEPPQRTGQIVALDTLWSKVETEYAFTLEDDWEFYRSGFIEDSMAILEANPTIGQVWIRERNDTNGHPIQWIEGQEWGIMKTNHGLWTGLCFNPSLKRTADYTLIAPFNKWTQFNRKQPWKAESDIGRIYAARGFKAAILPKGYIRHLGEGRHVY